MIIREADPAESALAVDIAREAFPSDDEADLTASLLEDSSAAPQLYLLAFDGMQAVGHIFFTAVRLEPESAVKGALLAPLAARPSHQGRGLGRALVRYGLHELADRGTDAVFVLGLPSYYAKHGFQPADPLGYAMPFPQPDGHVGAWMMRPISHNIPEGIKATVHVADTLNHSEYWRE